MRQKHGILTLLLLAAALQVLAGIGRKNKSFQFDPLRNFMVALDSPENDLVYPIDPNKKHYDEEKSPISLDDPKNITQSLEYDPKTGKYVLVKRMGDIIISREIISFEEYLKLEKEKFNRDFLGEASSNTGFVRDESLIPNLYVGSDMFDRVFGGSTVDIRPRGSIDLSFGMRTQKIENPTFTEQQRKQGPNFDFDMGINMSVIGKIGEKLKLTTNYNTRSTFDFENQIKLEYTGFEDDIIKLIEAGHVSMPLPTTLIPGTQSLFGIKTQLQFGRLTLTGILTQQKSRQENIQIQGGAQKKEFEIAADQYDVNRHFFLSHYFRDNYEKWLSTLPNVNSPIRIEKIEVYRTNVGGATTQLRDAVAFMDLGEEKRIFNSGINPNGSRNPANDANDLYNKLYNSPGARDIGTTVSTLSAGPFNFKEVTDFVKTRLVKLNDNDYRINAQLGYISLNRSLNPDDVLAVAFQYTLDGRTYQVGEFSQNVTPSDTQITEVLYLKMLKSTSARPALPIWDLMMKNVYNLGAFQISNEDFRLDITYLDPGGGEKRYIPAGAVNGKPLIKLLELDNLNRNNDPSPDGIFDFVSGVTINPQNGRLIFPVVEPFGDKLRSQFSNAAVADRYVYDLLYDSTKVVAQQFPQFNRFNIKGSYKSSGGSEIYLGAFNLPRGSVKVSAGGQVLQEGVDFTVDYSLGRVKIVNEAYLQSGIPVNISFENNALFGFNRKALWGTRADYYVAENFNVGATWLRLSERPFTEKVNVGDDPIKNHMFGADVNYSSEAPAITKLVDRLPFLETKEKSEISFSAEGAFFKPGHSNAINAEGDKGGSVYIDDFEGSSSGYDLKFPYSSWSLASAPTDVRIPALGSGELFPESNFNNNIEYGYNRAKLAWYTIDPLYLRDNSATPDYIKENPLYQGSHYVREIREQEIFPNRESDLISVIPTFDLAYYPEERGPYNMDAAPSSTSAGIDPATGLLVDPASRWAGLQRNLETTDFEAANIEFIEFWVQDPYLPDENGPVAGDPGYLVFNLGNVSEDILKDSRLFFENGLPTQPGAGVPDETNWGKIPTVDIVTNSFDNDPDARSLQDVGYDGLTNAEEQAKFQTVFLDVLSGLPGINSAVVSAANADPTNDDFLYHRDENFTNAEATILERYKDFNDPQNNSPVNTNNDFNSSATNIPETEDFNRDYTLSEFEEYFQYAIPFTPGLQPDDHPFLVEVVEATTSDAFGNPNRWMHFKIPIEQYDHKVGNITDFKSIRFVRMFLTGFTQPKVMRFERLELVRNQWRRYQFSLLEDGEFIPTEPSETLFNLSAVSIEENSSKEPVNYVLPPGIARESTFGSSSGQLLLQNEQALAIEVCDLDDGDSRAIYKTLNLDIRKYGRLQMNVHANRMIDAAAPFDVLNDGDMELYIRMGRDFTDNFYEYSFPLVVTPDGNYVNENANDQARVWPDDNFVDVQLSDLVNLKRERNNSSTSLTDVYEGTDERGKRIAVKGNPDIGYVKTIMIGVRNPKESIPDGPPVCGEVWVNELRLNDINEKGGYAALARMEIKAADFANINLSANMHSIGFGTLEQRVDQRFQDNYFQFDASGNFQLGKFFGKEAGVQLPMFVALSNSYSNPQYDPYDLDIELKDKVRDARTTEGKPAADSIKQQAQDFVSNKSINFTNVKITKARNSDKKYLWDVQNFDLTYAYNEIDKRDPVTQKEEIKRHRGVLNWGYNTQPKYIYPFKPMIKSNKVIWKPIKEINFNLIPTRLGIGNEINRKFGETLLRDIYNDGTITPTYDKEFFWSRRYNFGMNLTKSIKADFSATNRSQIDEPFGIVDSAHKKGVIRENLLSGGRNVNYMHNASVNYNLPFKTIPFLNFLNGKIGYQTNFNWTSGPLNTVDTLGNIIRNGQTRSLNGDLNMRNLYSKIGFLKPYINKSGGGGKKRSKKDLLKDKLKDAQIGEDEPEEEENKKNKKDKKDEKEKKNMYNTPQGVAVRALLAFKKLSVNYSVNRGSTIPGFMPQHQYLGLASNNAPGWPYVFGYIPNQPWLEQAADDEWLSSSTSQNLQFMRLYGENLTIKADFEPFPGVRLNMDWERRFTKDFAEVYRVTKESGEFEHLNPREYGSFSISYISWASMFDGEDANGISNTFKEFEENRAIISERFRNENPYSSGSFTDPITGETRSTFGEGYGPYSQDVLIPAFIAAYGGKNANTVGLDVFKTAPKPNWRFTFTGLNSLPKIKDIFNNVAISHGYKSTLRIGSFNSDLNFDGNYFLYGFALDTISNNYYSQYQIPQIVISEQLSPLIGIDLDMKNGISTRFEYKRTRNLGMSFVDYQLVENKNTEFTLGLGYKTKGLTLPIKIGGDNIHLKNDVNFKFDMTIRDDKTVNYKLDQNTAEPTRGMRTITWSPTIDYTVNKRLNTQLYFDHRKSIPATSAAFPITNNSGGIRVKFQLAD